MCLFSTQVECNTKLDPTKTTLLKVRSPLPPLCPTLPSVFVQIMSLDGNASADKFPAGQHLLGDTLTGAAVAPRVHAYTCCLLRLQRVTYFCSPVLTFYQPNLKLKD